MHYGGEPLLFQVAPSRFAVRISRVSKASGELMLHVQKRAGGLKASPKVTWGLTGRKWDWGPKAQAVFWEAGLRSTIFSAYPKMLPFICIEV